MTTHDAGRGATALSLSGRSAENAFATSRSSRLKAERQLLTRERAMLRVTTSRPAPDLSRGPYNPN